jgi:hypothetical protein
MCQFISHVLGDRLGKAERFCKGISNHSGSLARENDRLEADDQDVSYPFQGGF